MDMAVLNYTPDEDIKVHEEGAIRLICRAFQSHENGLPEWLKNSADAYSREDAPEAKRLIIVIFDHGRIGSPPSISCLDFSGMTSPMIEENFRVWADPEAAQRGGKLVSVQGGHGNGGKCYMTQMFESYAVLQTVKQGRVNHYGVTGGSIRFGYIPDREQGRNFAAGELEDELGNFLKSVNCGLSSISKVAEEALVRADGFTLVTGVGPKGYKKRIPTEKLIDSLQEHPQMIKTLELCRVYVVVNGRLQRKPLSLPEVTPMAGAEEPRVIPMPDVLKDPLSDELISTTSDGQLPRGTLLLRTSGNSMRWKKKGRHNIVYKAQSGYIGYVPIHELDVQSSYRDHIYGECYLEGLETFKQNQRARLADSPLTRGVDSFISEQVQKYAEEFEARDRQRYNREEKNAISKINEALDRWKNRFLNELMRGLWGPVGEGPPPPPPPLPTGKPAKIELTLTHQMAGVGVSFRPTLRFFDETGQRIRAVPFKWVSEDNNVAMVDQDLLIINTFAYGKTDIHAKTLDGKVISNKVPLEVVHVYEIHVSPSEVEIAAGSRQKIEAICKLANGQQTSNIYLVWNEDNPDIARVSSSGLVFGFAPGETLVTVGDDKCEAKDPALVKVVPGQGRGRGKEHGRGHPLVLVSGEIDRDPDTQEYRYFSSDVPPVWQDAVDAQRNIWWINSDAPLAKLYLDTKRGYGYDTREWRMYHLERYVDVIVQIALTQGPTEEELLSVNDWIMKWGYEVAQIQAAAASDLSEFISTGRLPE